MANRFQNFYTTTLTTDIGANDDTIRVNTPPTDLVKGTLTLEARNPDKREIIKFTGVNDNLLTGVIRGAEGTRATTHNRNASVEMNVTAEMLNEAYESQSSLQDLVDKHFGDFIDEGAVVTVSARSISMTAGKVYIKGLIVDIPAVSSHTFTDNKDVAIDIDINGNLHYTESTIGSLAPLQPNRFRIWKAKVDTTIKDIVRGRDDPIDFTTLAFGNYSTTEVDTGFKWIDGKTIYKKTVTCSSVTGAGHYLTFNHSISSLDKVVKVESIAMRTDTVQYAQVDGDGFNSTLRVQVTATQVGINSAVGAANYNIYATIYYTKTT